MDNSFQLTTSAFFQPGNWRRFRQKKSAKFLYFSDTANLTQFHFVPLTKSSLKFAGKNFDIDEIGIFFKFATYY